MQITNATEDDYNRLIEIWEAAVRATHHFLSEEKIVFYREKIRKEYFSAVDELEILVDSGNISGFIGATIPKEGRAAKIEMLFVDPACHGRGFGRRLLEHVTVKYHPVEVDVNEQNPQALAFYEHCGFHITARSETDSLGDPYPVLHLSNNNNFWPF